MEREEIEVEMWEGYTGEYRGERKEKKLGRGERSRKTVREENKSGGKELE